MVTYTVHEPLTPGSDRVDRGVELAFIKDGFSWLTAICPPLGFLANGLWLFAIGYFFLAGVLAWALSAWKVDPQVTGLLFLGLNFYLGFEVSSLKRWMLSQTGWQTLGVVTGKTIADCERRFFESWLPNQPILSNEPSNTRAADTAPRRGSRFWPFGARG
ncbi:DUF2628 domain-containing protein [Hyphomicrobium methylovorum]|nr:DUF2628 domain-containing protein [Hyphomicrobium methylovorum]